MDIWAQIWPNPYPEGKVHKSLVRLISTIVDESTQMEEIYTMVEECGVEDECDALATSRAIWTIRDEMRMAANSDEGTVTA
jgi:hypothetical protein